LLIATKEKKITTPSFAKTGSGQARPQQEKTRSNDVVVFAGGVLNYKLFSAIRGALLYGGVKTVCFSHLYM
jgi:hypothetical protein